MDILGKPYHYVERLNGRWVVRIICPEGIMVYHTSPVTAGRNGNSPTKQVLSRTESVNGPGIMESFLRNRDCYQTGTVNGWISEGWRVGNPQLAWVARSVELRPVEGESQLYGCDIPAKAVGM